MFKKDNFANLEQIRLKHLEDKIIDALIEFNKDKKMQWIGMRFEKILLETLLKLVNKQIPKKYSVVEYETVNGGLLGVGYISVCSSCKAPVHEFKFCPHCGQKIDWE